MLTEGRVCRKAAADRDLSLLAESDSGARTAQRRRQRIDEAVHAQPDPRLGQDRLQAAGDPRLA
jgi:hypothetical protein